MKIHFWDDREIWVEFKKRDHNIEIDKCGDIVFEIDSYDGFVHFNMGVYEMEFLIELWREYRDEENLHN